MGTSTPAPGAEATTAAALVATSATALADVRLTSLAAATAVATSELATAVARRAAASTEVRWSVSCDAVTKSASGGPLASTGMMGVSGVRVERSSTAEGEVTSSRTKMSKLVRPVPN